MQSWHGGRGREGEGEREGERGSGREERGRGREGERERGRGIEGERERERGRKGERERERGREGEGEREKGRGREGERERERVSVEYMIVYLIVIELHGHNFHEKIHITKNISCPPSISQKSGHYSLRVFLVRATERPFELQVSLPCLRCGVQESTAPGEDGGREGGEEGESFFI